MGDVLGYARVSTGDQDVAGQAMRLEQAGAIKLFTDVRSGGSMDRPGLAAGPTHEIRQAPSGMLTG
jgi:DNA invertase Pin-like site-specific DNA recombinase